MAARPSAGGALRRIQRSLLSIQTAGLRPEAAERSRATNILQELATIPAAILMANDRGRYVEANERASRLTGYSRAELLRMSVWELTPTARTGLGRRLWREFRARKRMSGTYQLRHKTGRIVHAHYFAATNVLPGLHLSALVKRNASRSRAAI